MHQKVFPKLDLKRIIILCILIAIAVILKSFFTIYIFTPNNRIVFHNVPIVIASMVFGPIWGVISAAITDVSSIPYTVGWTPWFSIPQLFWGLVPGLFRLVIKEWKAITILLAEVITHLCVSISNTIVMGFVYGFSVAFGKVSTKSFVMGLEISIFEKAFNFLNLGEFVYMRIVFVFVLMIIKIPLDFLLIKTLYNRVIKHQFEDFEIESVDCFDDTQEEEIEKSNYLGTDYSYE